MRITLLSLAAVLLPFVAQAQVVPCGSNDLDKLLNGHADPVAERAAIEQADAELDAFTSQWALDNTGAERVVYVLPVVFHIIHNNGPENISDEQVEDAVRVLNDDFNRLNADWDNVRPEFLPLVANVGVEFRLAQLDPNGNCTKGITRTVSSLTNDGTQTMKNLIQWPRNKYLNIWVAASADGAAGYTYRPGSVNNNPTADGIVILHTYCGTFGTGATSRSRALTHEVGHWINLAHTWGNSNNPGVATNCNGDDSVSDTPNTIGWTICDLDGASCGSTIDNVENYMEYSYCCKMFTEGQKTRMVAALNSSTSQRNQLWTANNLTSTGVNLAPVLCAAEFSRSIDLICAGSTVTYNDISFHGVISREWHFTGGTPEFSDEASPVVTYNEEGTFPVQLTVTDGVSTLTSTLNAAITVLGNPGIPAPFTEGFESINALTGPEWFTANPNADNTFAVTNAAAFTGSKSVRILNTAAMSGNSDELLSRTYDMTGAEQVSITFRYAYAKRTAASDDALYLYVSNDCGGVWLLRKILRGSSLLTTGGIVTGNFVPNADQWAQASATNMTAINQVPYFRFKFVFTSDGGNNLYLDDININNMEVGIDELISASGPLVAYPNPTNGTTRIAFFNPIAGQANLDLVDAAGRTVMRQGLGLLPVGDRSVEVDLGGLPAGSYTALLRLEQGTRAVQIAVH